MNSLLTIPIFIGLISLRCVTYIFNIDDDNSFVVDDVVQTISHLFNYWKNKYL